ncbi:sphingolipid 4-desaturase/C4-monooxygenase, partial [Tremellales sp. Uapishka_1]
MGITPLPPLASFHSHSKGDLSPVSSSIASLDSYSPSDSDVTSVDEKMTDPDFLWTTMEEPHRTRRIAILKAHPEVRKLMGPTPLTAPLVFAVLSIQLTLALLFRNTHPFSPRFLATAYVVGGTLNQNTFLAIHEITHNLAFKSIKANKTLAIVANIAIGVPYAMAFKGYHIEHHKFLGVDGIDTDLPSRFEALVLNNVAGKTFFAQHLPAPVLRHPSRLHPVAEADPVASVQLRHHPLCRLPPRHLFWLETAAVPAVLVAVCRQSAPMRRALYRRTLPDEPGRRRRYQHRGTVAGDDELLRLDEHPLLQRWFFPIDPFCPFCSTLSSAFQVGYHNEHHDFPSVPWTRLPQLRQMAREFYDPLPSHKSWPYVTWKFITDPSVGMWSRAKRVDKGERLSETIWTADAADSASTSAHSESGASSEEEEERGYASERDERKKTE